MTAADALARIGELDLGTEAAAFRTQIRDWITANAPPGLAGLAAWNMPGTRSADRDDAMTSPAYRDW